MQKELKDFTDVELKALNWDALSQIERLQNQIKIVNDELALRVNKQVEINTTPDTLNEIKEISQDNQEGSQENNKGNEEASKEE